MGVLSILAGLRKTAVCVQKELAEIATACADAAKALDEGKADSVPLHEITIPSEGWGKGQQRKLPAEYGHSRTDRRGTR